MKTSNVFLSLLYFLFVMGLISCGPERKEISELLVVSAIAEFHHGPRELRLRVGQELYIQHYRALYKEGKLTRFYYDLQGSMQEIERDVYARDVYLRDQSKLPLDHNWYVLGDDILVRDSVRVRLENIGQGYFVCEQPLVLIRTAN